MSLMRKVALLAIAGALFHGASAAALKRTDSAEKSSAATSSSVAMATAYRAFREAEVYTTNAICSKKHCVNPIFPGLEDMHHLELAQWISSSLRKTNEDMHFCRSAITYDPALPAASGSTIKQLVQRQDNAAATTFYYHLYALGMEAWDYKKPEFANDCVKSIWRMACYTYFPRAEVGTMDGAFSRYVRPCQSSCMNYIRTCGVECCDESVQCVFSHTKAISHTQNLTTSGYVPHDGPSTLCTGGAQRAARPLGVGLFLLMVFQTIFSFEGSTRSFFGGKGKQKLLLAAGFMVLALSLQGCSYDVPIHRVGNWRAEPDYLMTHEFIPPGGSPQSASINSCSLNRLSQSLQCSGRGKCTLWKPHDAESALAFCECDRDWADPECRTPRKSQTIAYLLSIFFGVLGADQFYLGFTGLGIAKLLTLGGGGVWYVWDIVRIGSAPVYSHNFRTAADLPHFAFVLTIVMWAGFLGFAMAYVVTTSYRARKRKEAMLLSEQEENRKSNLKLFADAYRTKPIKQQVPGHGGDPGTPGSQAYLQHNPILAPGGPLNTQQSVRPGGYGAVPVPPMVTTVGPMPGSMSPRSPRTIPGNMRMP